MLWPITLKRASGSPRASARDSSVSCSRRADSTRSRRQSYPKTWYEGRTFPVCVCVSISLREAARNPADSRISTRSAYSVKPNSRGITASVPRSGPGTRSSWHSESGSVKGRLRS